MTQLSKPVYLGADEISEMYLGADEISEAYLGDVLVFSNSGYITIPLTFDVVSAGTINWLFDDTQGVPFEPRTIEYKLNDGNWTSISSTTAGTQISVVAGDIVQFRGINTYYFTSSFSGSTAYFNAYGNIMSLIDYSQFETLDDLSNNYYAFEELFKGTHIINANNLILPAVTLSLRCYKEMFQYCEDLVKTPALPATTLADLCYSGMFMGCYQITSAPKLPATTLAVECYEWMFQGCLGLTSSPKLSASTIENRSYVGMFRNCSNMNYIECFATAITPNSTDMWVDGVASAGTFVKDETMSGWTIGINGIPSGWTARGPITFVDAIRMANTSSFDAYSCLNTNIPVGSDTGTTIRVKYYGVGMFSDRIVGTYPLSPDADDYGIDDDMDFRYFPNMADAGYGRIYGVDGYDNDGQYYDITFGNLFVYDNISAARFDGGVQSGVDTRTSIRIDMSVNWISEVIIETNGVVMFDGKAAMKNGEYGLYDSVSGGFLTDQNLNLVPRTL